MNGDAALGLEYAEDGNVGHVSLACGGEGTVECDIEGFGFGMPLKILDGSGLRSHRVTARRANANAEKFS